MTSINLPNALTQYQNIIEEYQKLMSLGGPQQAAIYYKFDDVVTQYNDKVLGRIVFCRKDESKLVQVRVRASVEQQDITFLFEKTDEEAAREIRGALAELSEVVNK